MRKTHLFRKTVSILMTTVLLCLSPLCDLQMNAAYAAPPTDEEIAEENTAWDASGSEGVSYSPLLGELTDERAQNTKTFLREDGAKN